MKRYLLPILLVYLGQAATSTVGHGARSGSDDGAPRIVWKTQIPARDDSWYEFKAMDLAKDGSILLGAIERMGMDMGDSKNRLRMWRVGSDGKQVVELTIKVPGRDARGKPLRRDHPESLLFRVLEDGSVLLVASFEAARPWVGRMTQDGDLLFLHEIAPGRRITIERLVLAGRDGVVLLGHETFDAVAIKIDSRGRIVWEITQDRGAMEMFVDGVCTDDGRCTLLQNSGRYGMFGTGPSTMWVARYDANGKLDKETSFPGRYGGIARLLNGKLAVVYDCSDAHEQSISVRGLSADLAVLWSTTPVSVGRGFTRFRIRTSGDTFVVAGGRQKRPYFFALDDLGEELWNQWAHELKPASDYELIIASDGNVLLGSSVLSETISGFKNKVRLIALDPD